MLDTSRLSAVSESLFIPLYCRAVETQSQQPVIRDNRAVEIVAQLDPAFRESDNKLYRTLAGRKLHKKLVVTMGLRTRRFDKYVLDFLAGHEKPVIVNMGCGLDTRFERVDNGRLIWYDLDFPEVIDVKEMFIKETARYHFIRSSVLELQWMDSLRNMKGYSFLLLAEGLFMYLDPEGVKKLVLELQRSFPGAELVCEVTNKYWVDRMQKGYYRRKFQKKLRLRGDAVFKFGISKSSELEDWNKGIEFMDDWTYFDENEPKLGWFNWFKGFELFKRVQWVVHYKLN